MPISYLALDVGRARIGLAMANDVARIAAPLPALTNDALTTQALQRLIAENHITMLIVGWPRNLQGDETQQTKYVDEFVTQLKQSINIPIGLQDEAVTSVKAEAELNKRGKAYDKGEIDSLSAVYILEDFLAEGVH